MQRLEGAFIVSYCFSEDGISNALLVGKPNNNKNDAGINIINAFAGDDAKVIFDLLTEKKVEV